MKSKKYSLNKEDLKSIAKGACIACGGALLTYLSTVIIDIDFGDSTALVVAIVSILINVARKWLTGEGGFEWK